MHGSRPLETPAPAVASGRVGLASSTRRIEMNVATQPPACLAVTSRRGLDLCAIRARRAITGHSHYSLVKVTNPIRGRLAPADVNGSPFTANVHSLVLGAIPGARAKVVGNDPPRSPSLTKKSRGRQQTHQRWEAGEGIPVASAGDKSAMNSSLNPDCTNGFGEYQWARLCQDLNDVNEPEFPTNHGVFTGLSSFRCETGHSPVT